MTANVARQLSAAARSQQRCQQGVALVEYGDQLSCLTAGNRQLRA